MFFEQVLPSFEAFLQDPQLEVRWSSRGRMSCVSPRILRGANLVPKIQWFLNDVTLSGGFWKPTHFETSLVRLQQSKLCQVRMAAIKSARKLTECLTICRVFETTKGCHIFRPSILLALLEHHSTETRHTVSLGDITPPRWRVSCKQLGGARDQIHAGTELHQEIQISFSSFYHS